MDHGEVYTECYLCRMVTGDTTIDCRICGRIAHLSCLQSRGFLGSENQLLAAQQAQQGSLIGWSCPECEDVSQLLSADEMQELMERFDQYDKNGDNEFNFEDFLQQSHPIPKMTEEANNPADRLKEFSEYDRDGDNTVTWEEFKFLEALRILRKASQSNKRRHEVVNVFAVQHPRRMDIQSAIFS
ncbi:hypothetical protein BSL78_20875 [Apostichopus japonicus]|uniref:EF-hand domain-containing protein n=1 Tax=Stichopus japonicus TaxID=307972 RepID=A0A2G8K2N0_STIJA|nr:hypothetical protein BSL78_20875 [Apostichopus japonicus]